MKYQEPLMEIKYLESKDIVTLSGQEGGSGANVPAGGLFGQQTISF